MGAGVDDRRYQLANGCSTGKSHLRSSSLADLHGKSGWVCRSRRLRRVFTKKTEKPRQSERSIFAAFDRSTKTNGTTRMKLCAITITIVFAIVAEDRK